MRLVNTWLIPALIPKCSDDISTFVEGVKNNFSYVQIDLTDGVYVENKSWPFIDNNEVKNWKLDLDFELDLMVANPIDTMKRFAKTNVSKYIVHFASTDKIEKCIEISKKVNKKISFAVKIGDDIDMFLKKMKELNILDIQCMGIEHIGVQGEPFSQESLKLIAKVREVIPDSYITVDGGVKIENALSILSAGANKLVSGSGLIVGNIEDNKNAFYKKIKVL